MAYLEDTKRLSAISANARADFDLTSPSDFPQAHRARVDELFVHNGSGGTIVILIHGRKYPIPAGSSAPLSPGHNIQAMSVEVGAVAVAANEVTVIAKGNEWGA